MGSCFTREPDVDFSGPVDFNHFHILRAIGKGAFGKVCIVKKKDTKEMYAMKYMNKVQIIRKHAVENVFRESEILRKLEHNFLVNLWFTFQDQEDLFVVLDLMLGGDISYHLEKEGRFSVARVRLYVAELSLALDYLREHKVVHRDVKPANMLLDSGGHVHLTDFNVACVVHSGVAITSVTGTKPYMAPEVLHSRSSGYSYAVDWWGLGVSVYEMLRGQRPFSIDRHMSNEEIVSSIRRTRPSASVRWDHQTCDLLRMLLHPDEDKRLQSVASMKQHRFFQDVNWDEVERKETTPIYIPAVRAVHNVATVFNLDTFGCPCVWCVKNTRDGLQEMGLWR
jgi:serine/threonine kinase 32